MAVPDQRLGEVNPTTGVILIQPELYATGETYVRLQDISPNRVDIGGTNYFYYLRPGNSRLDDATRIILTAIAQGGGSGDSTELDVQISNLYAAAGVTATILNPSVFDDFDAGVLNTDLFSTDVVGAAATVTIPGTTGRSIVRLATGDDDDSYATLVQDGFSVDSGFDTVLVECFLEISATVNIGIEFGFNDAVSETGGLAFSSHDLTPVAVADDAVVLGFQNDPNGENTSTSWFALASKATVAQFANTGVSVATGFNKLTIALAYTGTQVDAAFYINDIRVAVIEDAVSPNVVLYPWISVKALAVTQSHTADIDYIRTATSRN